MVENQHFAWDLGHLFKSLLQFLTTTEILSYAENPAPTLVFLITDQDPNNHPGHQNSGYNLAMAQIII